MCYNRQANSFFYLNQFEQALAAGDRAVKAEKTTGAAGTYAARRWRTSGGEREQCIVSRRRSTATS